MLVLQSSSILKGPGGMRGKILVFLLEAGDQTVIFLVPLGDTVGPLFCGMSAGQTALSDARLEERLKHDGQKKLGHAGILHFHFWFHLFLRHGS